MMLEISGLIFLLLGGFSLAISALGIHILPNTLSKQHAATKAGTLSITLVSLGAILIAWDWAWTIRLLIISLFLILTLPIASHMLARAAVKDRTLLDNGGNPPAKTP
ncbi:monovalent cation/H(+) antiporter subunit G [Chelonobacter oris]|uniref:monovalent cation/H(+) antiporter subunit G n=1 Tax=Chelonobacter oris TaxID=505317 RepID=UPI00068BF1FB|nr:monovalent cation/H(+) antiporter subunit G [Chelonobacter oris]